MGGAAAAAGRDGAMPVVNPAGFGLVPSTTASLSASLYRYERLVVEDYFYQGRLDPALSPFGGEESVEGNELVSSRFSSFPGAASLLWHLGPEEEAGKSGTHHVLSANVIVTRNADLAMGGEFGIAFENGSTMQIAQTEVRDFTEYDFGPGYALRVGPLRIGVAAMFHYLDGVNNGTTAIRTIFPAAFLTLNTTSYRRFESLGFQPVVGAQLTLFERLSLGASVATPSLHITGTMAGQSDSLVVTPPGAQPGFLQARRFEGEFSRSRPTRLRFGAALEKPRSWALAADVGVLFPISDGTTMNPRSLTALQVQGAPVEVTQLEERAEFRDLGTVSMYAGGEVFVSDVVALRCGVFAEPSNTQLQETTTDVLALRVGTLGASLGVGLDNDLGEITFGVSGNYQRGQTVAQDVFGDQTGDAFDKVPVHGYGVSAFIGGAIDVGEFSEWANALRDPSKLWDVATATVTVSELDPRLAALAMQPDLEVLRVTSSERMLTGVPEYDDFFLRVARIRLAMQIAPALASQLESSARATLAAWQDRPDARALLARLWTSAREGSAVPADMAGLPGVQSAANGIAAAISLEQVLRSMLQDLSQLPAAGQRLVEKAQDQFQGPGIALLPAVLKNLGRAQSDLALAMHGVPQVIENLTRAFDLFTGSVVLPPGGVPAVISKRVHSLSALSESLSGDQGFEQYDSTISRPVTYSVTGIEAIDALFFQAGRVELALTHAQHMQSALHGQVAQAAASWKSAGRAPSQVWAALLAQLEAGASAAPADLAAVPFAADVYRTLQSVRATSDACEQVLEESANLSAELAAMGPALQRAAGAADATQAQPIVDELSRQANQTTAWRRELAALVAGMYRVQVND